MGILPMPDTAATNQRHPRGGPVLGFLFMLMAVVLLLAAVALLIKRVRAAASDGVLGAVHEAGPEDDTVDAEGSVADPAALDKLNARLPPVSLVLLLRQ
jgi:hypothetical protein